MKIYKIYATTKNGDVELISPYAVNRDKDEMLKIARRIKYDMKDFYKKVIIRIDTYSYSGSDFIEDEEI